MVESTLKFKITITGDGGVGKTSLLDQYLGPFPLTRLAIAFRTKELTVDAIGKTKTVTLQLWDTEGQERYRALTRGYYRGSHGIIIMYDISNRESFEHVVDWLAEVDGSLTFQPCKLLIGNKSDLSAERHVEYDEGAAFAAARGLLFVETSARTGENVDQAYLTLAQEILHQDMRMKGRATEAPLGTGAVIRAEGRPCGC